MLQNFSGVNVNSPILKKNNKGAAFNLTFEAEPSHDASVLLTIPVAARVFSTVLAIRAVAALETLGFPFWFANLFCKVTLPLIRAVHVEVTLPIRVTVRSRAVVPNLTVLVLFAFYLMLKHENKIRKISRETEQVKQKNGI